MINETLKEAANILGLPAIDSSIRFNGLCTDSRTITKDALFVAIPGTRVNGHDFIDMAKEKGAAAALVTHRIKTDLPQLVVDDIYLALGKLAANWRQRFHIPFVGVTGSNGKTTLKNLIGSILSAATGNSDEVLIPKGTFNNHLGLPLTLARLNQHHRFAVIEMGMNHFGEIEYLTKLTQPDIALITNASASHIEGVGSIAGVARAKAEIFLGLKEKGIVVLNKEDNYYDYWSKAASPHQIISFGLTDDANVKATLLAPIDNKQHFTLHTPIGSIDILLPLLGIHNIRNALAATAAALALHIDLDAIKRGLENAAPEYGRMQSHTLNNGATIIDDTYNANPFSLEAALNTLAALKGKRILVLGDMKELGPDEKQIHHTAGDNIRKHGIDYLFTYGQLTSHTAKAYGEKALHFNDQTQLVSAVKPLLQQDTTILVKGSRSMHMETVVKQLMCASE